MKRSRFEEDSGTVHSVRDTGLRANKLPRSEVEKIISNKVRTAIELSNHKMKDLMGRISEVKSEPRYDARIQKLEAHVMKIKRRGDAVFAYIRKLRSLGSPSLPTVLYGAASGQPQQCISAAEPRISSMSRGLLNGGCSSDRTSVSSADNNCEVAALKRPKKGYWESLQSKELVVDLTEEDGGGPNEKILVTQLLDQRMKPPERSKPPSTPPTSMKAVEEDTVSSSVQFEEEDWHSKLPPFPETPFPKELPVAAASHNLPQKPVVKLARIGRAQELGIAWNVDVKDPHAAEMDTYYIYVAHELRNGTFAEWKCLGVIKAMPLPMACKVSDCRADKRLCFIVVGRDIFGRYGPYSDVHIVGPGQK
ncbi:activating transcription factor 7-interacting protein 2-like isoform X1 [Myxocyprinus asiaticus]|uniref:activating transcription factor 7-interacting protein 2-like isoform X1 n=1 Tax=Myxocyprinus asiaticus TaxID=70543 RepID=UPI002223045A|nr:activating transcription factor 7-interacting protein 2-like isoform X1 [Myxocyprinus asiaticus]XP_051569854.1 activating transcription factor 7-interacting protein 2-like isoform X1 [Myxocyprinus asiaticus]XP_051569855.1 activating transcription factor 7-interacting protein 2-like isoform X1 [Myxocyprinus asiaticus]